MFSPSLRGKTRKNSSNSEIIMDHYTSQIIDIITSHDQEAKHDNSQPKKVDLPRSASMWVANPPKIQVRQKAV